ncbi:MAG: hypothetical protein IJL60_00020 [Clostridiales bacterium]|nr:hypothetical protein [Clostridiales bacterium]
MTNFFFFIPIPLLPSGKENLDRPERQKKEHRGLITCILVWVFILLLCLGWIFYILNPPTGGYRNFEKIGTVDCYLNGTSTQKGCIFRYYTPDSPELYTSIISKKRAAELDVLQQQDPFGNELYQMDIYSTGRSDYFVCTYPDMDRKEAWKDYKKALFDNSVSKDADSLAAATCCSVVLVLLIIVFAYVLNKSIRDSRTEQEIGSVLNKAKAEATPVEIEIQQKEDQEDQDLFESFDASNTSWHK